MMSAERYKTFCTEENVVSCRKDATPKNTRNTRLGTVNMSILASNDNNFKMFVCFSVRNFVVILLKVSRRCGSTNTTRSDVN